MKKRNVILMVGCLVLSSIAAACNQTDKPKMSETTAISESESLATTVSESETEELSAEGKADLLMKLYKEQVENGYQVISAERKSGELPFDAVLNTSNESDPVVPDGILAAVIDDMNQDDIPELHVIYNENIKEYNSYNQEMGLYNYIYWSAYELDGLTLRETGKQLLLKQKVDLGNSLYTAWIGKDNGSKYLYVKKSSDYFEAGNDREWGVWSYSDEGPKREITVTVPVMNQSGQAGVYISKEGYLHAEAIKNNQPILTLDNVETQDRYEEILAYDYNDTHQDENPIELEDVIILAEASIEPYTDEELYPLFAYSLETRYNDAQTACLYSNNLQCLPLVNVLAGEEPELTQAEAPVSNNIDDYVTCAEYQEYEWSDDVGNDFEGIVYAVPAYSDELKDAANVNQQIVDFMQPYKDEIEENMENHYSAVTCSADYQTWLNQGIAYVLIEVKNDWSDRLYQCYAVSIEKGEQLDQKQLLEIAGMDEAGFRDRAKAVLQAEYEGFFSAKDVPSEYKTFYDEQLERTISDANIDETSFFIDEKGQPMLIAKVYSLAGADYYWQLVKMDQE